MAEMAPSEGEEKSACRPSPNDRVYRLVLAASRTQAARLRAKGAELQGRIRELEASNLDKQVSANGAAEEAENSIVLLCSNVGD